MPLSLSEDKTAVFRGLWRSDLGTSNGYHIFENAIFPSIDDTDRRDLSALNRTSMTKDGDGDFRRDGP